MNNGRFLGICARNDSDCACNGNSDRCEAGFCLNCAHHTEGASCERCQKGYYGEPRNGVACQKCPCPLLTNTSE